MGEMTRRQFIGGSAAVVGSAAWLAACGSSGSDTDAAKATTTTGLGDPSKAPFDTVVVLMMENRSFDHVLGWMPGADGKQAGLSYIDKAGASAPDLAARALLAGLAVRRSGPRLAVGSDAVQRRQERRVPEDPAQRAICTRSGTTPTRTCPCWPSLARNYTLFDHYFCALGAATWPNRFYMHSAATDVDDTGLYPGFPANPTELPPAGLTRPSNLDLAIWDRVKDKGLSGGYYYHSEPMTGLYASRSYDGISYLYDQFKTDAAAGKLPNVTYVDPEYGTLPELQGTSNDMHPARQRQGRRRLHRRGLRHPAQEPAVGPHGVRAQLRRARWLLRPRARRPPCATTT